MDTDPVPTLGLYLRGFMHFSQLIHTAILLLAAELKNYTRGPSRWLSWSARHPVHQTRLSNPVHVEYPTEGPS